MSEPITASHVPSPATGNLLVIAPPSRAEHLVRALEEVPATARAASTVDEALGCITDETLAIVIAPDEREGPPETSVADAGVDHEPPPPDASPEAMLEALAAHERAATQPVLVVVDDGFPDARARRLHAQGAAVVLGWPSEVRLLPGLVLALRDASLRERRRQPPDAALDEAVGARLAVDSTPAALACRVDGPTATLRGRTDSPWRARRLRDLVANVPGIERVDADALDVVPPQVPDEELDRTVRDVIRSAMGDALATITVETREGEVTLTGTLASAQARRQLERVVENVPGVHRLDVRIEVRQSASDRSAAG